MTELDFRTLLNKLKGPFGLGWIPFIICLVIIPFFVTSFFYDLYLLKYKISEPIFASIMFIYTVFFIGVFAIFSLFLVRLYTQRKRGFLRAFEIILHPFVNLLLLSGLFLSKVKSGLGFAPNLDLLIGFWMIFSTFFVASVVFIWSSSFSKKENSFQTVWIYHLVKKALKRYIFTSVLLVVGFLMFIYLPRYFLNISLTTTTETIIESYLNLISFHLMVLIIVILPVALIVNWNPKTVTEYCKTCLELIKQRFSKKVGFASNEEYTYVFPDVINRVNGLLKWYHDKLHSILTFDASCPPRILNKDQYPKKLLIADIIQDKQRLDAQDKQRLEDVKEGLDKISESLELGGDRFFYLFVEGLTQIANSGETKPLFNKEDGFELKRPSLTRWLKEHHWILESAVAFTFLILAILGLII